MGSQLSPAWKRLSLSIVLGLLALGLAGCSRSAQVSGTVKYQGKLVTSGHVVFVDQENRGTPAAYIQPDGTYLLPSVPVGPARILIGSTPPPPPESGDQEGLEYQEYKARLASYVPIPQRYMDLNESGQTFEVKSGGNTCNIELE